MDFNGDLLLRTSEKGDVDIKISNGQPVMTDGIENAAFLSIFCKEWWGNSVTDDDNEKFDSKFESVLSKNLSNYTRLEAEDLAISALRWMESSGMVKKITISSKILSIKNLEISILFDQPDSSSNTKFRINWENMRVRMQ